MKRSTETPVRGVPVYLGLGSNVGARVTSLRRALGRIRRRARVEEVSSFYRTDPVGHADQRDFVNAVARVAWSGSPEELLDFLKGIKSDLGRVPRFANGPREIDLDVLDFGSLVRSAPDPVLPHPRMTERRFVLAPLAEIAPRWRHPVTGESAKALLAKLPAAPAAERMRKSARA